MIIVYQYKYYSEGRGVMARGRAVTVRGERLRAQGRGRG
jgi:hypothetical protein